MPRSSRRFLLFVATLATVLFAATTASARGGGGFLVRPGFVPSYSAIDLPSGPAVSMAFGGRGLTYAGPFLRLGGEGAYDVRTGIGSGGLILEGAIPIPGPLELDLGGVVGGGSPGLYIEPGMTLHIGGGAFAFECRLSYQWFFVTGEGDGLDLQRGQTYVTFGFLFGEW